MITVEACPIMSREQYLKRSLVLRSRLAVANIIWQCDPTLANRQRAAEALLRYNEERTRLFERFCRPGRRLCR